MTLNELQARRIRELEEEVGEKDEMLRNLQQEFQSMHEELEACQEALRQEREKSGGQEEEKQEPGHADKKKKR